MQKLSGAGVLVALPQASGGGEKAASRAQEGVLLPWTSCQVTEQQREILFLPWARPRLKAAAVS